MNNISALALKQNVLFMRKAYTANMVLVWVIITSKLT